MSGRAFVRAVLAVAVSLAVAAPPAATGADAGRARAKVTFELGERAGFEYRWEYNVHVRIRDRATGRPLPGLRVVATGHMSAPGHAMTTFAARIRDTGDGVYAGKIAFYMPGEWSVRVSVRGAFILPALTTFRISLR